MRNNTRANEIMNTFTSFTKNNYRREEVLSEMFKLEEEAINFTFNGTHVDQGNLKLHDVTKHFEQMSIERCGRVIEEVNEFRKSSFALHNLIKAELSGHKGESKTFRSLNNLKCRNTVLKNVELSDDDNRTELDAVVVTAKGVFIIEVKNTAKDIFISEDGVYYRVSEYMRKDCYIKSKMELKEMLLRKALGDSGKADVNIEKIVVFTNDNIEVRNKCESLKIAFLNLLPELIDDYAGEDLYNDADMHGIVDAIEAAKCAEKYPADEVVDAFKRNLAVAMATLELAEEEEIPEEFSVRAKAETPGRGINFWAAIGKIASSPYAKEIGYAVAELALSAVASKIVNKRVA